VNARKKAPEEEMETRQVLYNGIRLPPLWPPQVEVMTGEPMPVPYLAAPPPTIPIDVGRQLFVDDFLVEHTTLRRSFHAAEYHPANPVLRPDKSWENEAMSGLVQVAAAMPFSDGVWYDPADELFKMFYLGGFMLTTCLATSKDGVRWDKPSLGVEPGTNIVVRCDQRDSNLVWLDHGDSDPQRRFKMFSVACTGDGTPVTQLRVSPDGIRWSEPLATSPPHGDRSTVFYNPFRRVWVHSIRSWAKVVGRCRSYVEDPDPVALIQWRSGPPVPWVACDRLDPARPELKVRPELYTLDAVAYESIMLGAFSVWRGEAADGTKKQDVVLGFSRDGFHWHRPNRGAFLGSSERAEDWNWGYVHSAGGVCLVVGDKLHFYACGRSPVPGGKLGLVSGARVYQTGLATLRRDGFASMEAGASEGTLTTRPVRFSGRHMFVNACAARGGLRVEILSDGGRPIAPFTKRACVPIAADATLAAVNWDGAADLSSLAGRPVRFRFHLREGALYSFWVSPDESGASHGYVAAGGPGFPGPTDTAGRGPVVAQASRL
jgi:hypothetical protein